MVGRNRELGVCSCRVRTCFIYVIKPICYSFPEIRVYSGDLCDIKSYPSLECLLCIYVVLERVKIS